MIKLLIQTILIMKFDNMSQKAASLEAYSKLIKIILNNFYI